MRVIIDYDRCEGNGVCLAFAYDVFDMDDQNRPYLLQEHPSEELRSQVEGAVAGCPTGAISLVED